DTLEQKRILESLIERTKPVIPEDCRHLDYLLATPFRYDAPPRAGSRFRRPHHAGGVFYASEESETAVAEIVFYRLLFFAESPGTPWPKEAVEYTGFSVALAVDHAVDLMVPPFVEYRATWIHPTAYEPCQELADAARSARLALIRYESVRDPRHRANLAVLVCGAFSEPHPIERHTWRIRIGAAGAQALCEFPRREIEFASETFTDPRLAPLERRR
ncbi:MAG: RES family NAD+ phosphorylase, partial [Acidobacteria bacterium]|nr:RES family NAD+ phosphorylase [Acidobacteriota bacterium]